MAISLVPQLPDWESCVITITQTLLSCHFHKVLNFVYYHFKTGGLGDCDTQIVVMQDSILFNLPIKENLLLAKPSATDEEIKEACKQAYIDEFIESLPEKYMTLIGEKGVKLSGGQKQRLAIARVLLANPNVVIFDEATSSLDHESEKMIHSAIDNISKDKTVIIIAHRLSSIISADRVIVLENGSIVGDGHHSKLIGINSAYDLLFKKQYEGTKAS